MIFWQFLGFIFRIPIEMKIPSVQEIIFGASMHFQNLSHIVSYLSSCCDTTKESREVCYKMNKIQQPFYDVK